ncbi:MAG: tRNA (guanosine(46)-N7)-methyltransferase TrmB [Clostridiales Family XIII bacterium]|jgi:tRNA (guanine-N7-)-methyltransferase|nr:tRNA (guanosine(46)-N7)-methyltransferase TrmB [Clostridiales Family XIII bacterium]
MRQRRIKDIENKLAAFGSLLVTQPERLRGQWRGLYGKDEGAHFYAEIGCGKGRFVTASAQRDPDGLYLGLEGHESVLYRALQRACAGAERSARDIHEAAQQAGAETAPPNLRLCRIYLMDARELFESGELDGIFLNFSDPWPKARQEKRRLTSPAYLASYAEVLAPGAFLRFKTDNPELFAYSKDTFLFAPAFEVTALAEDLHNSPYAAGNIETEYERKFRNLKRAIRYIEVRRR